MKETRNKKLVYLLISIIGITSLLIGSYAFVDVRLSGNKKQVIKAGNLNLTLDEKDGITLENALPVFDEVGMIGEPYTFTLKNESAFPMKYALKLIDISKGDNYLAYEDIRYGLTKNGQNTFGSISELDNLLIDEGSISSKEEISYELRLWINYQVMDNTKINGKSRTFKVGIEASKSDDDIILAATLNGEAVSKFPTREDNYGVESITCSDNLSASFNPLTWSVTVDGVTNSNTKCIVNFSSDITLDETDEALTMSKSELYAFYKGTFSGTASSSEVLSGKTVYINGVETTGTMPNNGSINATITTSGGKYTIPAGYHDGTGTVTGATLESLVGNNVMLDSATNLLEGVTAYGKDGVKYTGTNKGYDAGYSAGISNGGGDGIVFNGSVTVSSKGETTAATYTIEKTGKYVLVLTGVSNDAEWNNRNGAYLNDVNILAYACYYENLGSATFEAKTGDVLKITSGNVYASYQNSTRYRLIHIGA